MVPDDNYTSSTEGSPQSKSGAGSRRGRRGGRGRPGRGRGPKTAKLQPTDDDLSSKADQVELDTTVEEQVEASELADESAAENLAQQESLVSEGESRDFDEEPPPEIVESQYESEPEEHFIEPADEPPAEIEIEPESEPQAEPGPSKRDDRRQHGRHDRRDSGRHRRHEQRPQRRQESRPPQPTRERVPASPAAVHEAIELVNQVIENLQEALEDMEEVLQALEVAERQKTADEQEIESLRRMLKQMHRPREGAGSHYSSQHQYRGR